MAPSPSSASATAQSADAAASLRNALTDKLVAAQWIRTPGIEAAFRRVPRHAFAPEADPVLAYADDVVGTRYNADGRATSSVSAPWLQADMLEVARLQPGHNVLEIGSGGYNAALAAELVGHHGSVTTVDIDPAITTRARRFLDETGYHHVRVVTADGAHIPRTLRPVGGFDAVIVTVETWDLPWTDLIADGGRLVVPLRIHGLVWSIAFTKCDGLLVSDTPWTVCGFVPMRGTGAHTAPLVQLRGGEINIRFEDGSPINTQALTAAFDGPKHQVRTGVTVGNQEPFDRLQLYLATTLPHAARLSIDPDRDTGIISPRPRTTWPAIVTLQDHSLARLAWEKAAEDGDSTTHEFITHGYGPTGSQLARLMAEQVQHFDRHHRAAGYPRLCAVPHARTAGRQPHGPHIEKRHVRLDFTWPTVPGGTA
ncbi:methyltransferase, FxLD system [Streptomyces bluensis]|uniref:methyltransferase, FxLD system n=1 Tax=Streptomyces bluensis TaxID=33897 RepID=UPI0033189690